MKRFLLNGAWHLNAGPANVNKAIIDNRDDSMGFTKSRNRILRKFESIFKCITYPIIVFSAYYPIHELWLAKFFHKRIIILAHGCAKYENKINNLNLPSIDLKKESKFFAAADIIVTVSAKYIEIIKHEYPNVSQKLKYCHNGIDIANTFFKHNNTSTSYKIAVSGGNRPIKRNYYVCKAIEKLILKGFNIELLVFGRLHKNGEKIDNFPFVKTFGQIDNKQYQEYLKTSDLFVLNSETESFGLALADAINCGCSLLISENVGAIEIINNLRYEDVIHNFSDIDEIAGKISHLLKVSNAEYIFNSIDSLECSKEKSYHRLKEICLG